MCLRNSVKPLQSVTSVRNSIDCLEIGLHSVQKEGGGFYINKG